jgi:hypothetical protein
MMLCKLAFYLPQASHHPLPPLPHYTRRKLSREQADDVDAFGFPDDGYDYRLGPLQHANTPLVTRNVPYFFHSRHMRNSGGGVFIPPVDVSHVVKPREQTKEEIEVWGGVFATTRPTTP